MSHIETGRSTLVLSSLAAVIQQSNPEALARHPSMALLRQALQLVINEHGGQITPTYANFSGQPQTPNTHLALTIPGKLPRGIGLCVDEQTGALVFQGDPWKHRAFFAQVQKLIAQHYQVLAYCAAATRMRYQVSTRQVGEQVVITAEVCHG